MAADNSWQPMAAAAMSAGVDMKTTNKVIEAQKAENQAMREYNAQQAAQANEWNIQQWERENAALRQATAEERAYNAPTAQKARLEAAGLNADMMYGQGGISNTSSAAGVADSPQLVNSDYGDPMDWSVMNGYKTIGQAWSNAIELRAAEANIKNLEANAQKTLAEAGLSEISLKYADAKEKLGLDLTQQQFENAKKQWEELDSKIANNREQLNNIKADTALKEIEHAFKQQTNQHLAKKLASEAKISEAEAQHALQYFAARTLNLEAQNAWSDAAWIVQQAQGTGTLIKYGSGFAETILNSLLANMTKGLLGKKGGKAPTFDKMNQEGNVITWSN